MEHTNISKVNIDRLRLIAIEAIEQSGQITIPKIYQSINFNDFIKQIDSNEVVIACTLQNNNMFIDQIIKENHTKNISILIGPEGDFSKLELEKIFEHNNIVEATLGKNILKGETAAIVASALVKENIKVC
jgi:16S rRNA (uracil1498-N3)-methyltransferase